jgi:hypothetical protein
MATHTLETKLVVLRPRTIESREEASEKPEEPADREIRLDGNVFRGLLYAMLFNLFLLLTAAAAWGLWRLM